MAFVMVYHMFSCVEFIEQERKKAVKEFNKERRQHKTPKAEKKRKEKLAKQRKGLKA